MKTAFSTKSQKGAALSKIDRSYAISAPQGWFSVAGMWLAIGIVAVTVAYTVLTQALAIIPVDTVGWLLQTRRLRFRI